VVVLEPVPYKEYISQKKIDLFYNDVCMKKVRPSTENVPEPITNLLVEMWQHKSDKRPDFRTIIDENSRIIMRCAIRSRSGRKFWEDKFENKFEVDFDQFLNEMKEIIGEPDEFIFITDNHSKEKDCLKDIFGVTESNIVHIDNYGLVVDWFGAPLDRGSNLLRRILTYCSNEWFYGDISRNTASNILSSSDLKNSFLVRFYLPKKDTCLENPPISQRPFSFSYKLNKSNSIHSRVEFDSDSRTYKMTVRNKDKQRMFEDFAELPDLITEVIKYLKIKAPDCAKSKYQKYFTEDVEYELWNNYVGDSRKTPSIDIEDILSKSRVLNESSM